MKAPLIVAVLLLVGIPATLFFVSVPPQFEAKPGMLGINTPISLAVTSPHGTREVSATLEQGTARSAATVQPEAASRFVLSKSEPPKTFTVNVPAKPSDGFQTGPAKLTLTVTANDFRGATATRSYDVQVDVRPPMVVADGLQHYINQAGMELVTFKVAGYYTEAGVRVGKYTFRSWPRPGGSGPNDRFAYFAYPWDLPPDEVPVVYAKGADGKEVTGQFWFKLFPKPYRQRTIPLDDRFLQKAVGELDPSGSGELLPRFLKINREMRQQNNQTLADLRDKTEPERLWKEPFRQLSNSKVEAQFADVRSYTYQDKKVDQQVHLGFDLSVTANVAVVAANDGKVVWADRLGIYGNCIVVDHGYGLQSIYAHLSEIGVKPGQSVKLGETLGKSGATGLAGGDHLHYSMQLDGVQINPVEWWDPHWIQDRILSKLAPATAAAGDVKPAAEAKPAAQKSKSKSRRRR